MPWKVRKSGERYRVVNEDTGRTVGLHDTKAEAERQKRALYANVHKKKR